MSKAHPFAVHLEHTRIDPLVETGVGAGYLPQRHARGRPSPAAVTATTRATSRAGDERPERRSATSARRLSGTGSGAPGVHGSSSWTDAPRDLKSKEGIAARAAWELYEFRGRIELDVGRGRRSRSSVFKVEGRRPVAETDVRQRQFEVQRGHVSRLQPGGRPPSDRPLSETAGDELKRTCRRSIEPLDIVDRQEDRRFSASDRTTPGRPSATARESGAGPSASLRSSATSSARLWGSGRPDIALVGRSSSRSPSAANADCVSESTGRLTSTRYDRARAT